MLKSKHIYWNFFEQCLYIYALLVPNVTASYFCQFKPECDGNYYSGTYSPTNDNSNNHQIGLPTNDNSDNHQIGLPTFDNTDTPHIGLPTNGDINDQPIVVPEFNSRQHFPKDPENESTSIEPVNRKKRGLPDTCCQDCICGRNCIRTKESCCFPELTHTTVDESIETCTYTQSPVPYVEMRHDVLAYYMVDSNPPDGCRNAAFSTQHQGKQCGEVDAAYWGSLHPVSSISTGKIYRNIHCPACHGVTDAKPWQARGTIAVLGNYLTQEIEFGSIRFLNIDDTFNEFERRCFRGRLINNCPSSEFFIPETLEMDAKTVASACLNERFSPYIHEHVYSNVFCLICNTDLRNYTIIQDTYCVGMQNPLPFTTILSPLTTNVYQKEQQQLACLKTQYHQVMPKCRTVLCQSGTILVDEECQYVTEAVTSMAFMVNIVLMSTSSQSPLQLQMETINELSNHLTRTWGDYWKVQNVAETYDVASKVDMILVNLIYIYGRVTMPEFLDQIKINLKNSSYWARNARNVSVNLKPSNTLGSKAISRETIDVLLETVKGIYGENDDRPIKDALNTSKTYKTVFSEPYELNPVFFLSGTTTISEMFYCEQIELLHNEFVMVSPEIVYIKHINRLLYRDQFIVVSDRDGHEPKIRICLYESGFSLNISSSVARIRIVISNILAVSVFNAFVCLYSF